MDKDGGAVEAREDARGRMNPERLERYTLLDDVFMRAVFRDDLPLAQRVLRILTGMGDLALAEEETQRDVNSVTGAHSVVLDVYATDGEGSQYDMEVQRGEGLDPLRFRFYGSAMDLDFLKAGEKYQKLPRRWIVVVLERDPDGAGRATRAYSYAEEADGTPLGDGTRLLYVNASYRGNDELGSLMADFCEPDPERIGDDLLRNRVQYLKRTAMGRREMGSSIQEIYDEGAEDGARRRLLECVRSLIETTGWSALTALERLKVPAEDQEGYLAMLQDTSQAS